MTDKQIKLDGSFIPVEQAIKARLISENDIKKEQIIIDGVDVSGCEFYQIEANELYPKANYCGSMRNTFCEIEPNCYYKQLKCKEQECERLRGDLYFTNEQLKDFKSHYDKVVEECENLREKHLKLKEQNGSNIVQLNTVNEQLDQLKADRKEALKQLEFVRTLNTVQEAENMKLSKALTEIKVFFEYEFYGENIWVKEKILQKISEVE